MSLTTTSRGRLLVHQDGPIEIVQHPDGTLVGKGVWGHRYQISGCPQDEPHAAHAKRSIYNPFGEITSVTIRLFMGDWLVEDGPHLVRTVHDAPGARVEAFAVAIRWLERDWRDKDYVERGVPEGD